MADTTCAQKSAIVTWKAAGLTDRQVAEKENVAPATVCRINKRYSQTRDFDAKGRKTGRPTKFTEQDRRKAARLLSSGRAKNASDLKRNFFPDLHVDTIRHGLRKRGLKAYVRQSKPLLTRDHVKKRLDWAERHCYWSAEDWRAVIFSDESKFNLFGSDGRQWTWRYPGEANDPRYTKKKVKHGGGSVMVWGCVTRYGVGELHRIEGIMDRFVYVDILKKSLLRTLDKHNLDRRTIYFQQDGD